MQSKDQEKKALLKKDSAYKNFVIPDIKCYMSLEQKMYQDYLEDPKCKVCLHVDLTFLADSGIWQASKDKMKPGLPYAHPEQQLRYICGCCNWYFR